jgi:hypothetical protein
VLVVDLADFDGSFPAVAARVLSSIGDALHVARTPLRTRIHLLIAALVRLACFC